MNYFEFFLFAEDHIVSVTVFSILITVCYIILYRKYIQSISDPFFLIVIIAGLSSSTVFFLYFNNAIKPHYFYEFIGTEISFLAGFFLIKPIKFKHYLNKENAKPSKIFNEQFTGIMFYITSIVHIILQLITYVLVGIPLFLDSRMSTYAGGSGFGIIGRIIEVASVVGIFLLFYRIFYEEKKTFFGKIYNAIYLLFILVFFLLSGSKANLIFLVYYLFFLNLYMSKIKGVKVLLTTKKIFKYQKLLIYISIPLIFLIIYIQYVNSGATQEQSTLLALGQRVISFGDVYYMTFPNDVIKVMNNHSSFLQLFKDPLGMLRIAQWDNLPKDCGIEIYEYHYPNGTLSGPNARYNYFAILYYNIFGQIIYCFILGLITSFIRNTFFKLLPNNIIFGVIYTLFSINLVYIYQDQAFTIARFFNIIVILPIFLLMALIIQFVIRLPNKTLI